MLDLREKPDIGKIDLLEFPEVEKMNDDRYRKCGKGNQEEGINKAHQTGINILKGHKIKQKIPTVAGTL